MKNNNKIIPAIICVVLIAAMGAVAYLAMTSDEKKTTTTVSQTSASESSSSQKTTNGTADTTQSTTQSTTADEYAFLKNGAWYLVDKDNEECLAIIFKGNGDADIAFFNSDNIEGFDAQYAKGYGSYDIRKNRIIFSKLPSVTGIANLELEISGKAVKYKGKELKQFKEISLDNALKCFE